MAAMNGLFTVAVLVAALRAQKTDYRADVQFAVDAIG